MSIAQHAAHRFAAVAPQKVVVVNGTSEVLELFETVLEAGRYDMVFVEASGHAYSRIKSVQPDLIILCLRLDDAEAFSLLSMLKLDGDTRRIPIVTHAQDFDAPGAESGEEDEDADSEDFPSLRTSVTMN